MAGQLSLAASHGAAMLEQLRLPEGGSVLEIGAGTGYNTALLSGLVGASGRDVTVDIDPEVAEEARSHLGWRAPPTSR